MCLFNLSMHYNYLAQEEHKAVNAVIKRQTPHYQYVIISTIIIIIIIIQFIEKYWTRIQ